MVPATTIAQAYQNQAQAEMAVSTENTAWTRFVRKFESKVNWFVSNMTGQYKPAETEE